MPETVSAVDEAYVALKFVAQPVVIVPRVVEALPKMLSPVNVLLFARSVEEAAVTVIESPLAKVVPLMVPSVPEMYPAPTVVVPTICPAELVERSASVRPVR